MQPSLSAGRLWFETSPQIDRAREFGSDLLAGLAVV
jgi:hypothetical protein